MAVPIADTFAEAFPMTATRLVITAETPGWAETADSGKIEVSENLRNEDLAVTREQASEATTRHVRDFLDCVKSRKQARSNALAAAQAHITAHAAYIAFQLGRKLTFDPATDTFINDPEANRMRSRAMREPWRI